MLAYEVLPVAILLSRSWLRHKYHILRSPSIAILLCSDRVYDFSCVRTYVTYLRGMALDFWYSNG